MLLAPLQKQIQNLICHHLYHYFPSPSFLPPSFPTSLFSTLDSEDPLQNLGQMVSAYCSNPSSNLFRVKSNVLNPIYKMLHYQPPTVFPISCPSFSHMSLCSNHTSLLLTALQCAEYISSTGPLHLLFSLPRACSTPFPTSAGLLPYFVQAFICHLVTGIFPD